MVSRTPKLIASDSSIPDSDEPEHDSGRFAVCFLFHQHQNTGLLNIPVRLMCFSAVWPWGSQRLRSVLQARGSRRANAGYAQKEIKGPMSG